jgi:hypothetical protein
LPRRIPSGVDASQGGRGERDLSVDHKAGGRCDLGVEGRGERDNSVETGRDLADHRRLGDDGGVDGEEDGGGKAGLGGDVEAGAAFEGDESLGGELGLGGAIKGAGVETGVEGGGEGGDDEGGDGA